MNNDREKIKSIDKLDQNEVVKYILKAVINYKLWTHPKIYFYANKISWSLLIKATSKWFDDITFPKALPVLHAQRLSVWAGLHRVQAQATSLDFEIWSSTEDSKHIFVIWFPFPSFGTNWRIKNSLPFWSYMQSSKKEFQQLLLVILWKSLWSEKYP